MWFAKKASVNVVANRRHDKRLLKTISRRKKNWEANIWQSWLFPMGDILHFFPFLIFSLDLIALQHCCPARIVSRNGTENDFERCHKYIRM